MKHILITLLLVLIIVGNAFAFDWPNFIARNPNEQEVVRLLGKPSKAGTLYDEIDYETFLRINKLDVYMLKYEKSLTNHSKLFQSPLGVEATFFEVWFAKPGSLPNKQGKATRIFSIDFFFSGEDRDKAFTAFKFDKKCDNEDSACFFTQKCWQVTISPSKEYKNYSDIFAQKYEDGFDYMFTCFMAAPTGAYCLDDLERLSLKYHIDTFDKSKMKKECEESKKGVK
jgi:hypothetical protein